MSANNGPKPTYPINLCLEGTPVLVVGAGAVGRRKIAGLLAAGAVVTVVAPEVEPEVLDLAEAGRLVLERREYRSGDIGDRRLVFSATGVRGVDEGIVADAHRAGVLVNVADVPDLCDFYLPAVVRRGHLQLSVTTDGRAPFAARRLREELEALVDAGAEAWTVAAGEFRDAVREAIAEPAGREALFDRFFATLKTAGGGAPDEATWRGWIDETLGSTGPRDSDGVEA